MFGLYLVPEFVTAGLDPAVHSIDLNAGRYVNGMDDRVKPGHDE